MYLVQLNNDPTNGNHSTSSFISYRIPEDAPNNIVYQCANHSSMVGQIEIVNKYGTSGTSGSSGSSGSSGTSGSSGSSGSSGTSGTSGSSGSSWNIWFKWK